VEYGDVLLTLAEIGISVAGFAGVVTAFGTRRSGEWTLEDRLRFSFLLVLSLTVVFFSILPFPVAALHVDGPVVWRLVSGILAVWIVIINIIAFRQLTRVRRVFKSKTHSWTKFLVRAGELAFVLLLSFNTVYMAEAGLFLLALIWLLLQSIVMFAELLGFFVRRAV
jgi:hypothetical protein